MSTRVDLIKEKSVRNSNQNTEDTLTPKEARRIQRYKCGDYNNKHEHITRNIKGHNIKYPHLKKIPVKMKG